MPHIFCDFDGVLVDFERGYKDKFGHDCHSVTEPIMWRNINSGGGEYWLNLPALTGSLQLWAHIAKYKPTILTGCPRSNYEVAAQAKRLWAEAYIGEHVPVITCLSKNKPEHMIAPGDILIDDLEKNIVNWTNAGGVAVHHTDVESTIAELIRLGIV